ncbi:purine-binding chemotaxis protein CheW [Duganella sp. SG902]|uniref:chemotaxis protein CheW n=1 Tax=Duganella sp. SG902 TaxID=2587016 RepID=UPI00159E867B|nr:chemotaxis protein CheW [Duganella sp. SG902]NVM75826.1 purine-binding chemotaxis protein CheW [Duganella sp. SG902]
MHAVPAAEASGQPAGQRQYLTFMLAGEVYAIGILGIKEIIEYAEPTAVPCLPAFLRGVINLRGAVVPVVDLAARLGRAAAEPSRRTCVVIVEVREDDATHDVGVVVDAVNAVLEIAPAQIEPPPAFGAAIRADFIAGMGKLGERFVILLDIDRVLSVAELEQLAGAAGRGG